MKKLLLTTAIAGVAFTAAPALAADGVKLELGGHFKGYGAYVNQDEAGTEEVNDFDMVRHTEIHFGGETTLDNGLTVGAHFETDADGGDDLQVQESYIYMSGAWGRVNVGAEDGVAYLLQIEPPTADANIDGLRQVINPINYDVLIGAPSGTTLADDFGSAGTGAYRMDYDQNPTLYSDKLTYLSPIMNGFQLGLSYSPDTDDASDVQGIGTDDVVDAFGAGYEAAFRYEGQFNNVGVNFGAGYSLIELEEGAPLNVAPAAGVSVGDATDDRHAWNVGLDLDFGAFGLGALYKEDDYGNRTTAVANPPVTDALTATTEETWVIGGDYTTGPFKFGVSYFNQNDSFGLEDLDTERYMGGVTYTYGPGMTFRGSIGYAELEGTDIGGTDVNDVDATFVTLGTQINF